MMVKRTRAVFRPLACTEPQDLLYELAVLLAFAEQPAPHNAEPFFSPDVVRMLAASVARIGALVRRHAFKVPRTATTPVAVAVTRKPSASYAAFAIRH